MKLNDAGVSTRAVNALKKKDIYTVLDFLEFAPRKYFYFSDPKPIEECEIGEYCAVIGKLVSVSKKVTKTNRDYIQFKFNPIYPDGVKFTAQMYTNVYKINEYFALNNNDIVICGKVNYDDFFGYMVSEIKAISLASEYSSYIEPVYSNVKGVSDYKMNIMRNTFLRNVGEILEKDIIEEYGLMLYRKALIYLHYPESLEEISEAKKRLIFNDLLYFNMSLKISEVKTPDNTDRVFEKIDLTNSFIDGLPFSLTSGSNSQESVLNAMFDRAREGKRNNVLLQGDVGCGKTIVAAAFMVFAYENGYQSVLMAPREVLAKQHYDEIKTYADSLNIKCAFLHSGMKVKERRKLLKGIESGEIGFIIGTHSCISDDVIYNKLGAVIVDEEHLFGVNQKQDIIDKALDGVHSISMSATPIPRSLATVLYGDQKQMEVITKKPAGRLEIKTTALTDRYLSFEKVREEIEKGRQVFVVCPAIEENKNFDIIGVDEVEKDYKKYFEPLGIKIASLNGKMKSSDMDKIVQQFVDKEIDILISTTVIEVGVNVPNATVMNIEQANRFGLASLHQLRGRVGRSSYQSYCQLICEDPTNPRIQAMCDTNDGFKIAQVDLELRGSGNLLGTEQSGENKFILSMFDNPEIFEETKELAQKCLDENKGKFLLKKYSEHFDLKDLNS